MLGGLQGSNPAWYGQLTGHLTEVCNIFCFDLDHLHGLNFEPHDQWGLRRYKWNLTILCIRCSRRLLLRWSPLQIKGRFRNSSKEFHTTFPPPGVLQRRARRSSRQEVTSLPNKLFLEDSTLVSLQLFVPVLDCNAKIRFFLSGVYILHTQMFCHFKETHWNFQGQAKTTVTSWYGRTQIPQTNNVNRQTEAKFFWTEFQLGRNISKQTKWISQMRRIY